MEFVHHKKQQFSVFVTKVEVGQTYGYHQLKTSLHTVCLQEGKLYVKQNAEPSVFTARLGKDWETTTAREGIHNQFRMLQDQS
jgi:hypothetical protein